VPNGGEFVPKRGEFVPRKTKQGKKNETQQGSFVPIVPNASFTLNWLYFSKLQKVCANLCQGIWHDLKKHLKSCFTISCKGKKRAKKGFVPNFAKCGFYFFTRLPSVKFTFPFLRVN